MQRAIVTGTLALVIGSVALVLLLTRVDRYVATALEDHLEAATGTNAEVGFVSITYSESRATVAGTVIDNPDGFATDFALRLGDVDVAIDPGSIDDDALRIRSIVVHGATLNAEQRGHAANIVDILEHMRHSSGSPDASDADAGKIVIEQFVLEDASLVATAESVAEPETLLLDPIRVDDIGQVGAPATYEQATDSVLGAIFEAARAALGDRIGQAAGEAVRDRLEREIRTRLDAAGR